MEAEERPTKLRKLSHDQARPDIPAPGDSRTALSPSGSPDAPAHDASIPESHKDVPHATNPTTTSNPILSELPIPDSTEDPSNNTSTTPELSKNQLKKIKRKAAWEAGREDRKAHRRAKDKEKKLRKRAQRDEDRANGVQNGNGKQGDYSGSSRYSQRWRKLNRVRLPISLVLDCSFDKLMTDGEIISLGSQLTRCYSDNMKALYASQLYVSSWTPETELRKRFEGLMRGMYRNWKDTTFIEEDFVEAGKLAHVAMTGPSGGKMAGMFAKYQDPNEPTTNPDETPPKSVSPNEPTTTTTPSSSTNPNPPTTAFPLPTTPKIIYLTSDSPHTLTTLTPYTTYIIGGLVDKNRHKSICYNTAVRHGIQTAKLPLAEYMQMTSRQVLTTNHVVEIMLRWLEVGDWGDAFLSVLPKRKGAVLRGVERGESEDDEEDGYSEDDGDGGNDSDDSSIDIDINVTRGRNARKSKDEAKEEVKV